MDNIDIIAQSVINSPKITHVEMRVFKEDILLYIVNIFWSDGYAHQSVLTKQIVYQISQQLQYSCSMQEFDMHVSKAI